MNMKHYRLSAGPGNTNKYTRSHHARIVGHVNMHDTSPAGKTSTSPSNPTNETPELLERRSLVCRHNVFEINIGTPRKLGG